MDFSADSADFNFSSSQTVWLYAIKSFMIMLDLAILNLAIFNIYNYLYKQQKYKVLSILIFYICAVFLLFVIVY